MDAAIMEEKGQTKKVMNYGRGWELQLSQFLRGLSVIQRTGEGLNNKGLMK